MKNTFLFATIGSIIAGLAHQAQAQTGVTLYGLLDAGLQISSSPNGNVARLSSGMQNGSRWGLRGAEDLGHGLKANFALESSISVDTGAGGSLFDRLSTVGLSGDWGAVNVGRRDVPLYDVLSQADPFGKGSSLGLNGVLSQNPRGYTRRVSNQFRYETPKFSGFSGQVLYSLGESNTTKGTEDSLNDVVAFSVAYAGGPVYAAYGYSRSKDASSASAGVVTDVTPHRIQAVAGTYDFQVIKFAGLYYTDKRAETPAIAATPAVPAIGKIDQRVYALGAFIPFGASAVAGQYGKVKDKVARPAGAADGRLYVLAYFYTLSKRTNLYTSYGNFRNDNYVASAPGVGGFSINGTGLFDTSGASKVFNAGIRHLF